MLQATNIHVSYEGETLFTGITFHVSPGERIALVGANGSGKSSLLKVLAGLQTPASGSVNVIASRSVAYLPQDSLVTGQRTLHDEMLSVFATVLENEERQRALERRMSGLSGDDLQAVLDEYAQLQAEFDRLGGYTIEREVGTVLHGLGFTPNDTGRAVSQFSGGWQSRIALGKTLLKKPDLLLLDEPTNHLDLATTEWLEEYLGKYSGALVLVSHDRYFLQRVTRRTLELERGTLTDYPGSYSWYVEEKERRREQQQDRHERQQRDIERQQQFIDRFRYKATKASAAKSREKMISKIERVDAPPPDLQRVKFRFVFAGASGRETFVLKKLARSYSEREVLRGVDLVIERGDKVAVVGPNGSGKSTLLRILAGIDPPTSGSVTVGHNVRRSYFDQHQAELLESGHTVYDEVLRAAPRGWTVTDVRTLLGRFLFTGEDVHKPIEVLSGGERSRVALVKMLLEPANTLLLDEPTNHLDIGTRDVLESAIRDYEGTSIVISHDRYFLDRVANKTLEIENGKATLYPGNYSEYRERKLGTYAAAPEPAPARSESGGPKRPPRGSDGHIRQLRNDVAALEAEITRTEVRLAEVQEVLAEPDLYSDQERYSAMLAEYGELQGRVEELNDRWERHAGTLEELAPQPSPDREDSTTERQRLLERLHELERLLENPDVYADEGVAKGLMDEYAQVYEALAAFPAADPPRVRNHQAQKSGPPARTAPDPQEADRVRARLTEVERLLTDPDLFLDERRSAPIIDEYGYLQERLTTLTAPDGRR